MKFYNFKLVSPVPIELEPDPKRPKEIFPKASGHELPAYTMSLFREKIISKEHLISEDQPPLDYFLCWDPWTRKEFDWILLDIFDLSYEIDYCPMAVNGWLISPRCKELLDSSGFIFGSAHVFHPAKLRYQGEYLDYYFFQYVDHIRRSWLMDQTRVVDPRYPGKVLIPPDEIESGDDLYFKMKRLKENQTDPIPLQLELCYGQYSDMFGCYSKGMVYSERLKNLLESSNLKIPHRVFKEFDDVTIRFADNQYNVVEHSFSSN